jgi:hypothetical protein
MNDDTLELDPYAALDVYELLELVRADAVALSMRLLELAEQAAAHHDALERVADLLNESEAAA